ncbi:MAG: hypothetical protein BJ554DRAFT_6139 [Olpidium bornovanus]|uniref:Uncharacterized protein n=1 Tax=Olpidium bornovanus TaxID=278681 RepID=A0A8H7ZYE5_9FUNG|nr:MAG: hypothetical protein BJ554DRAFT_6139 [Olpidium bornovanus]
MQARQSDGTTGARRTRQFVWQPRPTGWKANDDLPDRDNGILEMSKLWKKDRFQWLVDAWWRKETFCRVYPAVH